MATDSGQPRPPDEILQGGGPSAREVALGQRGERFVAIQHPGWRHPLFEQDEGLLLALSGAETEKPVEREPPQDVNAPLAGGGDPSRLQLLVHGIASELPAALQSSHEHVPALVEDGLIELELPVARRASREHSAGQQREHPADVGRRHEMQRAAHGPGADYLALGDRPFDRLLRGLLLHPEPERQERAEIVLRLDCSHPRDGLAGPRKARAGDPLVAEAQIRDVQAFPSRHGGDPSFSGTPPRDRASFPDGREGFPDDGARLPDGGKRLPDHPEGFPDGPKWLPEDR